MMPKWTSRPVIKPGDIIGKPAGWTPESDLDHFVVCPGCGALIDMRVSGWHFSMLASCPMGPASRSSSVVLDPDSAISQTA